MSLNLKTKLAVDRTKWALDRTFLAFLRTGFAGLILSTTFHHLGVLLSGPSALLAGGSIVWIIASAGIYWMQRTKLTNLLNEK